MVFAVLNMSKYIFALIIVLYTFNALRGFSTRHDYKQAKVCFWQRILILVFHLLGFVILFLNNRCEIKYLVLYGIQLVYFLIVYYVFCGLYKKSSQLIVCNMCMLLAIGFVMITRLNYDKGLKQFVICALGTLVAMFVPAFFKGLRFIRSLGWIYCFMGLGLLGVLLFCSQVFGANLVLTVGPVSIQPSEFVKILYVLFIASAFNHDKINFGRVVMITFFAAAHVIILVLTKDLGAALIFFVVYVLMLYVATRKPVYILLGSAAGAGASVVAYKLFDHIRKRVEVWQDPWPTIDSSGYQICQSLFAIGMGSWFGYGLGQGLPGAIPVAEKDFMFSVIAEEMGIVFSGCLLIICLNNFMLMMYIASRCRTVFYRLVAVGLGITYGFQIFLTVGGAMKLIPMTGVTLPFVSYGGSSVVSSLISFALILGIYNLRQDDEEDEQGPEKKKKVKKKVREVYT
ncbi:MAG: FtsW/RodA/SpoVE family cell cycle protein [Lachnospira sp.]|nr:FtsW/RodA/SpoVE family cell cycle protein [Lachnospira sp.]